jgi:hypothetical protein
MKRVTDFRIAELRIPAERFPLPSRVEELLRLYAGLGRWEGNTAVFELSVSRLAEIEAAMASLQDAAGVDH